MMLLRVFCSLILKAKLESKQGITNAVKGRSKSRLRTAHAIYPIPHGPGNSYQGSAARQFQPDGLWMVTNRHGPAAPVRHDNR